MESPRPTPNGPPLHRPLLPVYDSAVKNAETTIAKLTEIALRRYEMIEEGDRILVAVSGGKDSTTLAYDLAIKRLWWPAHYELRAIHISTDFCSCCKKSALFSLLEGWGIESVSVDVPVIGRLKPGRSMNCYWCSTQRRTELIRYAMANGFNKIALGHHLDDIVETLLMNMLYKGETSTMPPLLRYDKYPIAVIRLWLFARSGRSSNSPRRRASVPRLAPVLTASNRSDARCESASWRLRADRASSSETSSPRCPRSRSTTYLKPWMGRIDKARIRNPAGVWWKVATSFIFLIARRRAIIRA